jgi:hypothetical protein
LPNGQLISLDSAIALSLSSNYVSYSVDSKLAMVTAPFAVVGMPRLALLA